MLTLEDLKAALSSYYQAIESQKSAQPLDLSPAITQLEIFSNNPPTHFHPQLRHYLESRSYRKAWAWIQSDSPSPANCGKSS
jgi:hypothetical protein